MSVMKWFVLAGALLFAAIAENSFAQSTPSSSAAGGWMCPCGGRSVPLGGASSCSAACYGGGSRSAGGGMSALQQQQMALVQQAGNLIGQMLRKSLFGDPEQEAQRLAQEQAAIEQQRRIAEEQERHMEEAKNRLLAMMIGIGPANDLKPIGVGPANDLKQLGVGPANDLQPIGLGGAPDLQPMLGTGAPPPPATLANLPASSAMAQMTSAVYYSELAAKATTDEDAAVLADAAFSMTLGMPVNIPVPPATPALAVQNSDMPRIEAVRNDYRDAMKSVDDSLEKINNLEQQRTLVQQVLNDNQARLTDAERKTANDQARSLVASLDEQIVRERAIANTAQGRLSNATGGALELLGEFMQRKQGGRASVRYQYATSSPRNDVASAPKPASERKDERKPPDRQEQPDRPEPPDAFVRGAEDAYLCRTRNPGSYCAGLREAPTQRCVANYSNGYRVGETRKENKLREAYTIGQEARQNNNRKVGFGDPRSAGPCRLYWLEAYNSGMQGAPFTMIGR